MASLDSLSDGQRAVLQLLLRQNKSYDDLASLLKTDADAVRSRARSAVSAIGPDPAGIDEDRRNEIADYLLGQQSASRRAATREYLEGSPGGRAWARGVATALSPIANGELPDIPAEREEVAEAFDALDRRAARQVEAKKSSQLGGRLIAAGIGVALAIAIIIALNIGGDDDPQSSAATTTPANTSTLQSTTPTGDAFLIIAQASLEPPSGGAGTGDVAIVRFTENEQYRLALQAEGLPPSSARGSAYGVWLYTSQSKKQFLGFPDTRVGADGKLKTVSDLAPDTPTYREILLTRETVDEPKRPGTIVLRGRMITAAAPAGGGTGTTGGASAPSATTTTP
jgi:hypothetical protein